jgi:cephalosporin-C deacetylase-like acetyl esterase
MDASLFFIELTWMHEVKTYLKTNQMTKTLNLIQKQKLAKKVEPFILKEGIMDKVGQNNRMCGCLTTSKT